MGKMYTHKLSVRFVFISMLSLICPGAGENGPCPTYFKGCCPYTRWDFKMNKCIDCPIGYHWTNCSFKCPYPFYGKMCQRECLCEKDTCNFVIGCKNDCTSGYFGTFCNLSCPAGSFGRRCGGTCFPNCTVEYCNPVTGCHFITKTTTKLTASETAIEYGEHNLSKCINKSVSNVTEHDDLNAQTSELYV